MSETGRNFENMQNFNRSLVLRILSKSDNCTRTQLARSTGLTQASISKIVASLIQSGLVHEDGLTTGKLGRRSISISLNREICKVLAIKLARRSFEVGVFNLGGTLIEQSHKALNVLDGAWRALDEIKMVAHSFCERYGDIGAIGIAVPGPYLMTKGRIAIMSEFIGWENIDIRNEFLSDFDIPICIEHDANASSLAEWSYGSNGEPGTMISFIASEGIGAGVIDGGVILKGVTGVAGEVGHMSINMDGERCVCGNFGCLELYCSAISFSKWVKAELEDHPESSLKKEKEITAEVIFKHMQRGDSFAIESVKKVGRYIGYGLTNIVYLYNPREIIITDIMTGGGEILLNAVKETVLERTLKPLNENLVIRMTSLKHDTILMGAAALATEMLLEQPSRLYQYGEKDIGKKMVF